MKFDNHSNGPWTECLDQVLDGDGFAILRATENPVEKNQHRANVQRIVACVNACDGYSTSDLDNLARLGGITSVKAGIEAQLGWLKDATSQRDELQRTCDARLQAIDVTHKARMRERERAEKAEAQRDELLAALEKLIGALDKGDMYNDEAQAVEECEQAIARAKGGGA